MEEEPSNGKGADSSRRSRTRHTRTRNGCERCRARRRKCDEGRPRCQRCVDARVQCQYVTRISFHYPSASILDTATANTAPGSISLDFPGSSASSRIRRTAAPSSSAPENTASSDVPQWTASGTLPDGAVFLLRHYNQHVAPWLDIFDQDQAFANLVPRLGMTSPPVLRGILQLSVASSGRYAEVPESLANSTLTPHDLRLVLIGTPIQALQVATAFALEKVRGCMQGVPDLWTPMYSWEGGNPTWVLSGFDNPSHPKTTLAVAALMSRLEVAHSLVYQIAPPMDSTVLEEAIATYNPQDPEYSGPFTPLDAALRCIVIATDITKLCFDPPEHGRITALSPESRTTRWRGLMNDLLSWYSRRPNDMHALIEDERHNDTFRAIIFTNAGAAWANMMYHTCMLILITHKPGSVVLRSEYDESKADQRHMSSLWHVQRVCGIGISGNPQCWDPCMIAAFYLAAQRITQINQQEELIAYLERVRATGWHIEGLTTRLREEWCLPNA